MKIICCLNENVILNNRNTPTYILQINILIENGAIFIFIDLIIVLLCILYIILLMNLCLK